ncbi:virulence RhuM family protein [Patescibacteria group bacterium]|nr:virulence RhuM family protein [Patescibacteria group bacterium]MBU4512142.1 virulence RhuM family protein [Patescibacteria group bacterium]MCG2692501.1 virulence RhuM family protein [Candidatus Parcubacteria bacterium]
MKKELQNQIIIYKSDDGSSRIEVRFEGETTWLTQSQLVELFESSKANISEHIKHIFEENELDQDSVVRKFRTTASDGKNYEVEHYNLDMIISLGYRVKSHIATRFRIWATARLREYIVKGFTIDSDRLKNLGGGNYWKELLDEIRDIRSSEKVLYRQVLDLYATAIDYDSQASESLKFFKIVQNKLHFAAHGHTAAEVIYLRVDSDKPFAGLKNFIGKQPTQAEAMIAKNFLGLSELKVLNNLVSAYFDLAEINALEQKPMKMADYIRELDNILKSTGRKLLSNAGKISHEKAIEKASLEYRKYKVKNLSEVEKSYLEAIKTVESKIKKKVKS